MPSLSSVANLASGDVVPESYVDAVTNDLNYLVVAGADLASGATVTVTNEFHKVTGTTTIDNLSHAAPVAGQSVSLWCTGALTIRNNGGGTGNIRTASGVDLIITANTIVTFRYDGTNWRQANAAGSSTPTINAQTGTTYTLALSDAGNIVELNNASAITLTVPPNSSVAFPIGTVITIAQTGAGQVTITNGAGVTVNGANSAAKTAAQWAMATIIKRATDLWIAAGNLTP